LNSIASTCSIRILCELDKVSLNQEDIFKS